jgi:hypothetical protein
MAFPRLAVATTQRFDRCSDVIEEPPGMLLPIEGHEKVPLVSLEESVEPLVDILPDIRRKTYIAKANSQNPTDGLSIDESASIRLYSMEWDPYSECLYFALNTTLRAKDRHKLKPWFRYLRLILSGLSRLPSKTCHIYRGVQVNLSEKYRTGTKPVWWALSSCTTKIDVLQSEAFLGSTKERTLFSINCISGKDIRLHSYYENEYEILLPPACQFIVQGCLNQGHGLNLIQLQEIKPLFPLIEPVPLEKSLPPRSVSDPVEHSPASKLEEAIQAYQDYPRMNLSYLYLKDHHMDIVIQQGIIGKKCVQLQLSNNEITSEGLTILASALTNNTIMEELTLSNNRISDEGMIPLVKSLESNTTLKILGLGVNNITDKGIESLAQMLRTNHTLTTLGLNYNHIGDVGVQVLAYVLTTRNKTLQQLNLSSNKSITKLSLNPILDIIECNHSLNEFYLLNCSLSSKDIKFIREVAQTRQDLSLHI